MPDESPLRIVRADDLEMKFQQWRGIVDKMHATTCFTLNDTIA
jgi:hypothetical protein